MGDIGLGVGMFTAIVLVLVVIILMARAQLVSTGNVNIEINGEKTISDAWGLPSGNASCTRVANSFQYLPSAFRV